MFSLLSLLVCQSAFCIMSASAKFCDPANYICSGRCPDLPPNVHLLDNVALCMKDTVTAACVCWFKGDSNHGHNWFHCDAMINSSLSKFSCQVPSYCFPPDSEPTCLVMPICDCIDITASNSPEFQFGDWKPVKASVDTSENSNKNSKDFREFSPKHLLFLLGFVIAPLACWCLLNFINENKCKRKNLNRNQESTPIDTERRRTIDRHVCQGPSVGSGMSNSATVVQEGSDSSCRGLSIQPVSCLSSVVPAVSSVVPQHKYGSPPSYDEAINPNIELDEDGPPSYAEAIQGREFRVQQLLQAMLVIQGNP